MKTKCPKKCQWAVLKSECASIDGKHPCKYLGKRGKPMKDCPVEMRKEIRILKVMGERDKNRALLMKGAGRG